MAEEERLELIRLCNVENNKSQEASVLLKFANNYKCPFCDSNHVVKTDQRGKQQNQKLMAVVEKLNDDGIVEKVYIPTEELRRTNPWILLNFYESKIKFT